MPSKRRRQVNVPEPGTARNFAIDPDRLAMIEATRVYVCEQHGMESKSDAQYIEVYKYNFDGIKVYPAGRFLIFGNQDEFNSALIDMNEYQQGKFELIYPDKKLGDTATAIGVYAFIPETRPARN